jgi:hypothetical protein
VRASALVSVASRVGLGRLYGLSSYSTLPSAAREEVKASMSTPATLRSTIDEYAPGEPVDGGGGRVAQPRGHPRRWLR